MKSQSGAHRKVTHSKQDCDDRQGRIITIHIWYRRREGLFAFVIVWVVSDYSNLVTYMLQGIILKSDVTFSTNDDE